MCGFTYDVFVCAHDELRGWIEHVILPLEKKDPPYKLCWHMRDFMAGLPIDQQMVDAVYKSRKVAIIFSKHFMESKFCQLELEYAMYRQLQTRTRCLVPITFSDGLVPIQLRRRLTYLLHKDDDQLVSKLIESLGRLNYNTILFSKRFAWQHRSHTRHHNNTISVMLEKLLRSYKDPETLMCVDLLSLMESPLPIIVIFYDGAFIDASYCLR